MRLQRKSLPATKPLKTWGTPLAEVIGELRSQLSLVTGDIKNPSLQEQGEITKILEVVASNQEAWEENAMATNIDFCKFMRARVEKLGDNATA